MITNTELVNKLLEIKEIFRLILENTLLLSKSVGMDSKSVLTGLAFDSCKSFNNFINLIKAKLLACDEGKENLNKATEKVNSYIAKIVETTREAAILSEEEEKQQTERDMLFKKYIESLSKAMDKSVEMIESVEESPNKACAANLIQPTMNEGPRILEYLYFAKRNNQHKIPLETLLKYSMDKTENFVEICNEIPKVSDKSSIEALQIAVNLLEKSCSLGSKFEEECLKFYIEPKDSNINENAKPKTPEEREMQIVQQILKTIHDSNEIFTSLQKLLERSNYSASSSPSKLSSISPLDKSTILRRLDLEAKVLEARMTLEFNIEKSEEMKKDSA